MGKSKHDNWLDNLPWPIRFIIKLPFLPIIWAWKLAQYVDFKTTHLGDTCRSKQVITHDKDGNLVFKTVYEKNKGCVRIFWTIPLAALFYYLIFLGVKNFIESHSEEVTPAPTEQQQEQAAEQKKPASDNLTPGQKNQESQKKQVPKQQDPEDKTRIPQQNKSGNNIRIKPNRSSDNNIRISR